MRDPRQVAVVGVNGYTGLELAGILLRHPAVASTTFYVRETRGANCLAELFPQFRGRGQAPLRPLSLDTITSSHAGTAFLATPHEVSAELAPALLEAGLRVVDLSGAFRFRESETFTSWYKLPAPHAASLGEAVYGLPELYFQRNRKGPPRRQSRLLRHERHPRPPPARRSRFHCRRPERRLRLQIRCQRRWQRSPP